MRQARQFGVWKTVVLLTIVVISMALREVSVSAGEYDCCGQTGCVIVDRFFACPGGASWCNGPYPTCCLSACFNSGEGN